MYRWLSIVMLLLVATAAIAGTSSVGPTTTNNDDSCDIGLAPAATLLLPHFEVSLAGRADTALTTVFSIVNVSAYPQIARVTLWTDWAYPTITFNLFMTGYEVKSIDLRDLLVRGTIPTRGSPVGRFSHPNYANSNMRVPPTDDCGSRIPAIPAAVLTDVRGFLSTGRSPGTAYICAQTEGEDVRVGSNHGADKAAGYVTIDVVANCSPTLPTQAKYFTNDILFDNVFIGDYQVVEPAGTANGFSGGSPLVHIRAIPEGGKPGSIVATRLPYTFYDRLTDIDEKTARTIDRRQPLPSAFAARWIDGGPTGFETTYSMWREAVTSRYAACAEYAANDNIPAAELVRFDERENAAVLGSIIMGSEAKRGFSASSTVSPYAAQFPTIYTTDFGGWAYLNLSNGGVAGTTYSASRAGFGTTDTNRVVSQNWVVVNMFAEERYGVSYDAAWLGNGCSPALPKTKTTRIGPAANVNP